MKNVTMILGLLLALSLTCYSCASRQKEVHKKHTQFKYDAAIDSTYKFTTNISSQASESTVEESSSTDLHIEYDGKAGDSISVTEYGSDGKMKSRTTIQGTGKSTYTKGNKQHKKESASKQTLQEDTKLKASGSTKVQGESSTVTKDKNVESSGFSFWIWLWIIIICIVLVLLWYLNRQFGWFTWLKKRVLNKKSDSDTFAHN